MTENRTCRCAYCYTAPKGPLKLPSSILSWSESISYGNTAPTEDTIGKLQAIQEDVLRLLQWQVISNVYKQTHSGINKKNYDVSVMSFVTLSPSIVNNLFPEISDDLLPVNFVHQAFRAISHSLNGANTISHLLTKIPSHPLIEFMSFEKCCMQTRNLKIDDFFPAATSDIKVFLKLLHYIIDNICHKPSVLFISDDLKDFLKQDEKIGILTIYKQDKKDCITGYCSISKTAVFNRLKNHDDRIKPYTNPTMYTIKFENETVLIMTTAEIIMDILNLNDLHTPIEFVISVDPDEIHSFSKNIVYGSLNTTAFVVTAKKEAPCWCKHYVDYVAASISVIQQLLKNELVGLTENDIDSV